MLARRTVLGGAVGLSLATILADPVLRRAWAAGLAPVSATLSGGQTVKAALGLPAVKPAAAVLLVHEWWGLNDQIKSVAASLAEAGYVALAIDLYDGNVATKPGDARKFMGQVDAAVATETLTTWMAWLRAHDAVSGGLGTIGWCFGGGWSLNASLAAPAEATIVYYGNVAKDADQLASLKGPVLGHFATGDQWINKTMVGGFAAAMKAAGKSLDAHWYEANHAFANPTSARYDAGDAKLAWERSLAFLKANL